MEIKTSDLLKFARLAVDLYTSSSGETPAIMIKKNGKVEYSRLRFYEMLYDDENPAETVGIYRVERKGPGSFLFYHEFGMYFHHPLLINTKREPPAPVFTMTIDKEGYVSGMHIAPATSKDPSVDALNAERYRRLDIALGRLAGRPEEIVALRAALRKEWF